MRLLWWGLRAKDYFYDVELIPLQSLEILMLNDFEE
jgi:hypothetical protein